jgi:peptide chain release factor 1
LVPDTYAGHNILTIEIDGKGTEQLKNEAGAQRIQRVSPTEKRGRVHSSTITVAVIGENEANIRPYLLRNKEDFLIEWYNGTIGAGGQHHQKCACCARIKHIPTGIVQTAQTRSRQNSLKLAMDAINIELDKLINKHKNSAENSIRKEQVGTGERSDKRRTIRFQHDEVIDHITGKRMTAKDYMKGGMEKLW